MSSTEVPPADERRARIVVHTVLVGRLAHILLHRLLGYLAVRMGDKRTGVGVFQNKNKLRQDRVTPLLFGHKEPADYKRLSHGRFSESAGFTAGISNIIESLVRITVSGSRSHSPIFQH